MSASVSLTFPDGSIREFAAGTTGLRSPNPFPSRLPRRPSPLRSTAPCAISQTPSLTARSRLSPAPIRVRWNSFAMTQPIVMAEAVQELWPGTQVTIGPVIENGFYYDFAKAEPFTPDDLPKIEKKMKEIIQRNKPFTKEIWSRDKAKEVFASNGEKYKVELVDAIPEDQDLKIYYQGDWFDLCRGPHMASTGQIGMAFKLMKVAGAYWRGDSNNAMLSRIYGTAFAEQEDLDRYLHILPKPKSATTASSVAKWISSISRKKAGRRLLARQGLAHVPDADLLYASPSRRHLPGSQRAAGARQVAVGDLGHWGWYQENMFAVKSAHAFTHPDDEEADQKIFALKPMNCPGHVQIFKHGLKSYRELPVRLAEFGTVHRYEASGALHGLMRVRGFTQDDAHVLLHGRADGGRVPAHQRPDSLGLRGLRLQRDRREALDPSRKARRLRQLWDRAESVMMDVLKQIEEQSGGRIKTGILPGEERLLLRPKFEYTLRDAIGREWQCGTTQVDFTCRNGSVLSTSTRTRKRFSRS